MRKKPDIKKRSQGGICLYEMFRISKYIQTEWGLFPAWYFFTSGVSNRDGSKTISSERIKEKIKEVLSEQGNENLSDQKLCELLNQKGARIARRTVAKYRAQLGLKNSYKR